MMKRTVTLPVVAIVALAVVFVLAMIAATSTGSTGPADTGGLIDRVLPGGAPLLQRAPAPPPGR